MDSNITVYSIYKKGINTIQGNFPLYENLALIGCQTNNNAIVTKINNTPITDLYEDEFTSYLITNQSDAANPDVLISEVVDYNAVDPITGQPVITTYDINLSNKASITNFVNIAKQNIIPITPTVINAAASAPVAQQPINQNIRPKISYGDATTPPRPCQGGNPCNGASVTINYYSGSNNGIGATAINVYVSTSINLQGSLVATVVGSSGRYTINNLLGNTEYYISVTNNYGESSSNIAVTTPAYV
jgi:hypothetical protein